MKYWLLKSEPNVWSIEQQKKAGSKGVMWDGVRNYQARKNLKIRENLTKLSNQKKFTSVFPPKYLCSDNAAMIAWAGIERFKINLIDNLEFPSKARWPLDSSAPFLKGPGLKL